MQQRYESNIQNIAYTNTLALPTSPTPKPEESYRPVFPSAVEYIHLKLGNLLLNGLTFRTTKGRLKSLNGGKAAYGKQKSRPGQFKFPVADTLSWAVCKPQSCQNQPALFVMFPMSLPSRPSLGHLSPSHPVSTARLPWQLP